MHIPSLSVSLQGLALTGIISLSDCLPTYLILSLSALNLLGPLSLDLEDDFLILDVFDVSEPDEAWLTFFLGRGYFNKSCDVSLAFLTVSVAHFKFCCLVDELGEGGARLIRREVSSVRHCDPLNGLEAF